MEGEVFLLGDLMILMVEEVQEEGLLFIIQLKLIMGQYRLMEELVMKRLHPEQFILSKIIKLTLI